MYKIWLISLNYLFKKVRKYIKVSYMFLFLFLIIGCSKTDQSSSIEEKANLKFTINSNEPIIDILSTLTLQKKGDDIILNYINKNEYKFVTLNFNSKQREEIKFENEGPNSFGFEPEFFYRNSSNEIIAISHTPIFALCKITEGSIKLITKTDALTNLCPQPQMNFRPSLDKNNIIYWNLENKKIPKLTLFNIENFKLSEVYIPFSEEFILPFKSKTSEISNIILPFVSHSEESYLFSNWYSPNVYEFSNGQFSTKKLSLNSCEKDFPGLLNSLEKAFWAQDKKTHGPVVKSEAKLIYISENYFGPGNSTELVCLSTTGNEKFSLKETGSTRNRKFWLGDQLAILFINEEKNFLELKVYE